MRSAPYSAPAQASAHIHSALFKAMQLLRTPCCCEASAAPAVPAVPAWPVLGQHSASQTSQLSKAKQPAEATKHRTNGRTTADPPATSQ